MNTLVTGGTGFLGKHIVQRLLAENRRVTILARRTDPALAALGVRFINASLDDAPTVAASCAGQDTVFHVAAKVGVWGRYDDFYRANVLGTRAILEGCRAHGVRTLVYTSTPSVVYNGQHLANADESLPLTRACPSPYPLTKAIAEAEVLAANSEKLRTTALRPHLIWGAGDPHLVPRVLARARSGRLRIVGSGQNRVDMVHVENAADAHLLAEKALHFPNVGGALCPDPSAASNHRGVKPLLHSEPAAAGRAYFITNADPVVLWDWINDLLARLGEPPLTKKISLRAASTIGVLCETLWRIFPFNGEPPMTRFIAAELAKDHWFNPAAAYRDLGYTPRVSMAEGMLGLVDSLRLR